VCGGATGPGDAFCGSCGSPLAAAEAEESLHPPGIDLPPPPLATSDLPAGETPTAVPTDDAEPATGRRRRRRLLAAALALIVIVAGGITAFLLLREGNEGLYVALTDEEAYCPEELAGLTLAGASAWIWEGGANDGNTTVRCTFHEHRYVLLVIDWTALGADPEDAFCGGAWGLEPLRTTDARDDGTTTGIARHPERSLEIRHTIEPGWPLAQDTLWRLSDRLFEQLAPLAEPC
jgi:hypothetical protein